MLKYAPLAGIMYDKSLDPDIRSLRQLILYGLKGISAYGHQARELGSYSEAQEPKEILVGFGHHAALSYADKIVEAVKSGKS